MLRRSAIVVVRREWRLLLLATFVVVLVRVALWLLPSAFILATTRRLMRLRESSRRREGVTATRIAWAIRAVSRRIPGASCLTQAVAGHLLLRWYGHPSKMCLGVGHQSDGRFLAHMWIESEGRVLIGGTDSQLTRLDLPVGSGSTTPLDVR